MVAHAKRGLRRTLWRQPCHCPRAIAAGRCPRPGQQRACTRRQRDGGACGGVATEGAGDGSAIVSVRELRDRDIRMRHGPSCAASQQDLIWPARQ